MKDRIIPKEGDTFNAYTNEYGNLARDAPFVCCKHYRGGRPQPAVDKINYVVRARDNLGKDRLFKWLNKNQGRGKVYRSQDWTFRFEVLKKADVALSAKTASV